MVNSKSLVGLVLLILNGNLNYIMKLFLHPLMFDEVISRFEEKPRIMGKIQMNRLRINRVRPVSHY